MALQLYKIATVEVGSAGSATIDFTSIPQGYTDLKLVLSTRNSAAAIQIVNVMKFNALTTGYTDRYLYGSGSVTGSGTSIAAPSANGVGDAPGANATASTFGNQEIYIPNYTSSNAKSSSVDSVAETNGTAAYMELIANLNTTTSAITSITLYPLSGTYVQYSTATLYGIL